MLQGKAEVIEQFCQGYASGALHERLPESYTPAFADGHASGRLTCRAAVAEYLRERGMRELGEQSLEMFLTPKQ